MARVLIIDDDELFIKLMVHALKQRGHEVEFALDGLAGCRMFAASQFDVVVCDIVMPEQEGVETIKIIRRQRPEVGIVAISGGLSLSHTTNSTSSTSPGNSAPTPRSASRSNCRN